MTRAMRAGLLAGLVGGLLGPWCAPAAGEDKDATGLFYFLSSRRTKAALYVLATPLNKRSPMTLIVQPTKNDATKAYEPDPYLFGIIKDLKKGAVIRITANYAGRTPVIKAVEAYKPRPGEDEPDGFLFVKTEEVKAERGRPAYRLVVLRKFEQEIKIAVPSRKGLEGEWEPDPAMMLKIGSFKDGQVIEAETAGSGLSRVLTYVGPYSPPVEGSFLKLTEESTDTRKSAAIRIQVGQETKDYALASDGKGKYEAPDAKLLAAAKALKPGEAVKVKTRELASRTVAIRIEKATPADEPVAPKED